MANTTVTSNLQVIKFRNDAFREYIRTNRFAGYFGTGVNNPIVIKQDRGPTVRHPLVTRLQGSGVSGTTQLRGNGEAIGNYSWDTNPTYYRHSVEFTKEDLEKTNIALMREARPLLMDWAKSTTRDRIIRALGNNADRVIFGASIAHGNDFSAGTDGIDVTNDTCTYVRIDDMRRLAEDADPHIRPIETDQESEVFICFLGSESFKDCKNSLATINSNADVRGMKITRNGNVLARDGDLFWNGTIIRKVPEISQIFCGSGKLLATAGASTTKIEPAFFCGAQAAVWGLGQQPDYIVDRDYDYGFAPGVAVELKEDIKKAFFNSIQHGMVSGFFSGS